MELISCSGTPISRLWAEAPGMPCTAPPARALCASLRLFAGFPRAQRAFGRASSAHSRAQPTPRRSYCQAAAGAAAAPAPAATMPPTAADWSKFIPGFQRWVDRCNDGEALAHQFQPLLVEGATVGYLRPEFAAELLRFPGVFERQGDGVALCAGLATPQQRTAAVETVMESLNVEGKIEGWRNELYPVVAAFHDEPAFLVERAAATHLGIKSYGVHLNGYVVLPDGRKELWVARRSRAKPTWPGKLDHIVAGGQPHGLSCAENVVKECEEEASVPAELASAARAVGAVSYTMLQPSGLKRDVLYCYDLQLPLDFVPQPQDGEVEEFKRMPLEEVAQIIASTDEFKDNCTLVIIDFLLRHGYLTPDMPGYCRLLTGLQSGDCS